MKQLLSISLALIILASQLGFSLATHYCGDIIVERQLMLGQHSLDCGMERMDENCQEEYNGCSVKNGNCCDNHFVSIDLEDYYNNVVKGVSFDTKIVFASIPNSIELFEVPIENIIDLTFSEYCPPPLIQDVQILYQTFLL